MDNVTIQIINQINDVLSEYGSTLNIHTVGGTPESEIRNQIKLYTKLSDAVIRFAPQRSAYMTSAQAVFASIEGQLKHPYPLPNSHLAKLAGILEGLKDAYASGYIQTVEELVNSELFSDFLEMANYYLKEGHKDAAAVIQGGVLEEHLRKLCQKNGINLNSLNAKGETKSKNASLLNQDLVKKSVYNEGQKKQIEAWLAIRNSSAHGKYSEYSKEQVQNMLDGMRNFIISYPA